MELTTQAKAVVEAVTVAEDKMVVDALVAEEVVVVVAVIVVVLEKVLQWRTWYLEGSVRLR